MMKRIVLSVCAAVAAVFAAVSARAAAATDMAASALHVMWGDGELDLERTTAEKRQSPVCVCPCMRISFPEAVVSSRFGRLYSAVSVIFPASSASKRKTIRSRG